MYSPTSRVLTVLEILQARGSVPAAELAERLEVDPRSVRRYVTALRELGIPVRSTPGRHGGYRLGPGSKLPPLMFSDSEALAVVVGLLRSLSYSTPGETRSDAASALAKIQAVLPERLRDQMLALQDRLEFTNPVGVPLDWFVTANDESISLAIALAAQTQQRITLHYRAPDGAETTRQVDVYGLVQHLGTRYAIGWCHLRDDVRVFRLDRMLSVDLTADSFELPVDFDAREEVSSRLATAPYRWHIQVILDAPRDEVRPRIPDGLAVVHETPDGALLESSYEQLDQFARFIISLGYHFRIIEPEELHEVVREIGLELLRIAGEAPSPVPSLETEGGGYG